MVIFSEIFQVAQACASGGGPRQVSVPQSRKLAQELVLASALVPFCASDLSAPTLGRVFATDASLGLGACCSAELPHTVARSLWLNADRRGAYTRLDTGPKELLRAAGIGSSEEDFEPSPEKLPGQIPFRIDLLPIGRPPLSTLRLAAQAGLQVGPPINLSTSEHFDVASPEFRVWLHSVLKAGLVRGILLVPFTSGQPALGHGQGALRSSTSGFRSASARRVAGAHLVCFFLGHATEKPTLLLLPKGLPLTSLPAWQAARQLACAEAGRLNFCQFGSSSRRPWLFLACFLRTSGLCRPCTGAHSHFEGEDPSPDIFPLGLATEVSEAFVRAVSLGTTRPEPPGLESIIVNDVLMTGRWQVDKVVPWRGHSHINTLELGAIGILERQLSISSPGTRFTILVDSSVAKSSSAKGRSTSLALQPSLRRAMAHQIGFDIYPAFAFAPTRLNVADDPTRRVPLRTPSRESLHRVLPLAALHNLGSLRLRRPLASWARLFLVFSSAQLGLSSGLLRLLSGRFSPLLSDGPRPEQCDFDATLGYPGEGPSFAFGLRFGDFSFGPLWLPALFWAGASSTGLFSWGPLPLVGSPWVEPHHCLLPACRTSPAWARLDFDSSLGFPGEGWAFLFRVFRVFSVAAMAAPAPLTPADNERATRRSGLLLQADRVIRPATRSNRAKLASAFSEWLLQNQGRDLDSLIGVPLDSIEQIAEALVAYGQYLFRSGQAYYKYSETINAIASLRPSIRRSLSRPWDLAFAWLTEEPSIHHRAMPKSILLAVMSVALLWGWATEAAIFGLTWTGLLRIGETLNAVRSDLVLPDDAAPGTLYALLQIRAPKTRGRSARHQAARIDPSDIVRLLAVVFGPLSPGAKLWPFSDGVLRRRLRAILQRLCLVDDAGPAFDLASLRPGGATWLLQETENAEMVRRRGRWLSGRVMEIYLQEVTAITYVPRLPSEARAAVESLALGFSGILEQALFFEKASIPRKAWYYLFAGRSTALARKVC